jgi:putative flippase GtrA
VRAHPVAGRTGRYTIVGAICALAYNAVMILGDLAGGHYVPMTVLSFGIVTPLGYLLHARFPFREQLPLCGFLRFASGVAAGFPLSLLSMAILCTGLGLPYASAHWAILNRWRLN